MQRLEIDNNEDEDFRMPNNREIDRLNGPRTDLRGGSNFVKGSF